MFFWWKKGNIFFCVRFESSFFAFVFPLIPLFFLFSCCKEYKTVSCDIISVDPNLVRLVCTAAVHSSFEDNSIALAIKIPSLSLSSSSPIMMEESIK